MVLDNDLAFQTLYGYAYYRIGLMMASFMGGLVLGSLTAQKVLSNVRTDTLKIYKFAQVGICLYPLLLPVIFVLFRDTVSTQRLVGVFAVMRSDSRSPPQASPDTVRTRNRGNRL